MSAEYADFLQSKSLAVSSVGREIDADALHPAMFPFQRDVTRWAIRKGRAAIFEDTGLGKTLQQLEWARVAAEGMKDSPDAPRCLIVAPLAVATQTVSEGERWGIPVHYRRMPSDLPKRGIVITTYELAERFDAVLFGAVVLDESGILKAFDGKTRTKLIRQFARTPLRLCCTATPAPNDHAELANHAEFLGVMSRTEMLATFFVHDQDGWRLKGHARQPFYRWLASWAMALKRPSDLGYQDDGYALPPLEVVPDILPTDWAPPGQLFPTTLKGITERSAVRKGTAERRVARAVELVEAEPAEPWLIWCGLNAEQDAVAAALGGRCVSVDGPLPPEEKVRRIETWLRGDVRVLVTKPAIAGWGLNFQHCARVAFVGLSDSFESYYQAIRRCWRFGQTRTVRAHVILTTAEEPIWRNVLRKEKDAERMTRALVAEAADFERAELGAIRTQDDYAPARAMQLPDWLGRTG